MAVTQPVKQAGFHQTLFSCPKQSKMLKPTCLLKALNTVQRCKLKRAAAL